MEKVHVPLPKSIVCSSHLGKGDSLVVSFRLTVKYCRYTVKWMHMLLIYWKKSLKKEVKAMLSTERVDYTHRDPLEGI